MNVRPKPALAAAIGSLIVALVPALAAAPAQVQAASPQYDISTLAGKVASLNGTAGLQIRFSAFIEEEAALEASNPTPGAPISPAFVLSSPLDGSSVLPPAVNEVREHCPAAAVPVQLSVPSLTVTLPLGAVGLFPWLPSTL
jgi:hypothetical protein